MNQISGSLLTDNNHQGNAYKRCENMSILTTPLITLFEQQYKVRSSLSGPFILPRVYHFIGILLAGTTTPIPAHCCHKEK